MGQAPGLQYRVLSRHKIFFSGFLFKVQLSMEVGTLVSHETGAKHMEVFSVAWFRLLYLSVDNKFVFVC